MHRQYWILLILHFHIQWQVGLPHPGGSFAKSYVSIRGTVPECMLDLSSKLKELAKDETLTIDEVNQLREEIKAEFDRRTDILVPEFVTFYNTLNEDQRAKVSDRLDKISSRLEGRIDQ